MHFRDEKTGDTEIWKLEKKTTTREEALGTVKLPEPDPAGADHQPNESARALDGLALEAWKQGDLPQALEALRAGRRGGSGRPRAALPLRAAADARRPTTTRPARTSSGPPRWPRRIRRSGSTSSPSTSAPSSSTRAGQARARRRRWPAAAPSPRTRWACIRSKARPGSLERSEPRPPGTDRARRSTPRRITLDSPSVSEDDGRSDAPSGSSRRDRACTCAHDSAVC